MSPLLLPLIADKHTRLTVQQHEAESTARRTIEQETQHIVRQSELVPLLGQRPNISLPDAQAALAHDRQLINTFFRNLAKDLSRISGCKVSVSGAQIFSSATLRDEKGSVASQVDQLVDDLLALKAIVRKRSHEAFISCSDQWIPEARHLFPGFPLTWLDNSACEFQWQELTCISGIRSFKLTEAKLHDPATYTGYVPRRTQRRLKHCQTATYDYRPRILTGVMDAEYGRVVDPALVLSLGEGCDFVFDHWYDLLTDIDCWLTSLAMRWAVYYRSKLLFCRRRDRYQVWL